MAMASGCGEPKPVSDTFQARDGTRGIVCLGAQLKSRLPDALELAESTMRRSGKITDVTDGESQFAQINRIANLSQVPLSGDAFRIIDLAYYYTDLTDGAFDITAAPLNYLWGFTGSQIPDDVPSQELIDAARASMGRDHAVMSATHMMAFTTPLTRIDLGEMADGYGIDLSILQFRRNKITSGIIVCGGTARCEGAMNKLQPWEIPLPDPYGTTNRLGRLTLPEGYAVHTASLYDPFVTIGGKKYGHIFDPRTGYPAEGTISATVLGPTATQASALAQALIVLGLEKGIPILARFPRHDVLIIPDRSPLELWMTKGLSIRFKPDPGFKGTIHIIEQTSTEEASTNSAAEPANL